LLDVLKQYEILGFWRLGLIGSNLNVSKIAISNKKPNISQLPIENITKTGNL
jgi:hypothetical protein